MLARSAFRLLVRGSRLLGLGALLILTGSSGVSAASSGPVHIGSPPHHPAGSKVIGPLPGSTRLSITIALRPRDPAALANYATEVATPGSSIYRRYLTVTQFRQRFAPTNSEVSGLAAELRARGLAAGRVSKNGLAISVSASASAIAQALSVSFERVRLPNGRVAFANTAAPQFPGSVAGTIQAVVGLDSLLRPAPLGIQSPAAGGQRGRVKPRVVTGGPQACSAAISDGTTYGAYTADQLASAYRFSSLYGAGDLGGGQTVALFELEPYAASDISAYQSCYGTSTTVSNLLVDGGAGSGSGSGEAALDIENVIGLSPQVNIRVYEGPNTGAGAYDTYNQIISDNVAKVISTSWGLCEASEGLTAAQSENTLFQEAATQGQSIFAAAGDSGSTDCGGHTLGVDDPASQPYVTGVGGTTLSATGPPPTQSVWNDGKTGGGGGGGISSFWTMPSYQSGAASSLNVISSNSSGSPCSAASGNDCRQVPDVSGDADENTGYVTYYKGTWTAFGGTSAAAPLWAAFAALTNASTGCGGTPIGFANPKLYTSAGGAYASDFSDVTSGNNNLSGSGLYPAGTGYDMASGLGTPTGSGLPSGLCGASAPAVTFASPANGSATNNNKPAFSGTAGTATGDSSTITVKVYSGSSASGSPVQTLAATRSAGSWSVVPSTALADGTYTAQAQQTNTNGTTGYSSANTFIVDTVSPTNALSLAGKTGGGSYLTGATLYYQGLTAGSFKLQNAASDAGSGPASTTFAALSGTTTGWTFPSSIVSIPAGGPYVSNAFSWTGGTSTTPGETVTGTDTAGNTTPTTLTFTNDSSAPTGSITYANGSTNTVPVTVSFSTSDSGSGVNSATGQLQRASATLSNGSCGAFGGFTNLGSPGVSSPYGDSALSSGNCYEYRYLVSDHVGNQATIGSAGIVKIDATPPTQALSLTAATGAYLSGTTLYWNGSNTSTASFKLLDAVTDSGSGPASTNYPSINAAGWTHSNETVASGTGSPPTVDYTSSAYSWASAATNPPDQTIIGTDAAGNQVSTALHFVDDTTGPSGGSIDAIGLVGTGSRYSTSSTLSIAFSKGSDSQSGVAATGAMLERASATLSSSDGQANGGCGTYSGYTLLAADPTSPYADNAAGGIQAGHCYRYEYIVPDNVGNQTTYTSGDVKVQTTAPASLTPVVSLSSATGNTFISGSTVYTNPQAGMSGGFTVSATASDAIAGVANTVFPNLGAGYTGGGPVSSGPYSTTYGWSGATASASGAKAVTATDNAGLTATDSSGFTIAPDTAAPAGSLSYTNGYTNASPVAVSFSASDSGSGVNSSAGQLQRASAALSNGSCGAFGTFTNVGLGGMSSPYSDAGVTSGHCYEYRYLVRDNVGNQTAIGSTDVVKFDTSAPTNALTLTSQSGGGSYYSGAGMTVYYQGSTAGSFKLQNAVSDTGSGPASSAFAALGGTFTGWSFTNSTASSPAGGPYVSNAVSWTAGTTSTPTETVTSIDNAGNSSSPTTLSFADDSTGPTGTISTSYSAGAVSVSFSASDNGGSGVNPSAGQLRRASATLSNGSCGPFGGFVNVGPAGVSAPYDDASVNSSNCYEYEYVAQDHVGNQTTIGPSGAVKVSSGGSGTPNQPPVASFTFSPASPLTGQAVSFNGSGSSDPDGTISSYAWMFGDGGSGSGVTPKHSYSKAGTYTVRLSITDNSGSVGVTARALTISAPPSHAPTLHLRIPKQKLGSVLKRGLRLWASSNQPASAKLQLVLASRNAKRLGLGTGRHPVVIASLRRQLAGGKTTAITLKLTRKARTHLRRVKTIRITLTFTATGAGGKTTVSQSLLLKR